MFGFLRNAYLAWKAEKDGAVERRAIDAAFNEGPRPSSSIEPAKPPGSVPDRAAEPAAKVANNKHDWHDMPLGKIAVGVATFLLGAMLLYVVKHYLGLP